MARRSTSTQAPSPTTRRRASGTSDPLSAREVLALVLIAGAALAAPALVLEVRAGEDRHRAGDVGRDPRARVLPLAGRGQAGRHDPGVAGAPARVRARALAL